MKTLVFFLALLTVASTAFATNPPVPEGKHVIWGRSDSERFAITYDYKVFSIDEKGKYEYMYDIDQYSDEKYEQLISDLTDELNKIKKQLKREKKDSEKGKMEQDLDRVENEIDYTKQDYKDYKKNGDLIDKIFRVMDEMKFQEIDLKTTQNNQFVSFRNGEKQHSISWVEGEQPTGISDKTFQKMTELFDLLMQAV
jgi:hypothetical protein